MSEDKTWRICGARMGLDDALSRFWRSTWVVWRFFLSTGDTVENGISLSTGTLVILTFIATYFLIVCDASFPRRSGRDVED